MTEGSPVWYGHILGWGIDVGDRKILPGYEALLVAGHITRA